MHLDGVVALLAQHVDDLADKVLGVLRRPLRDSHHGLLAVLAALELLLGDEDVVGKDVSFGDEEGEVLLDLQASHGLVALVGENLGHHGLLDVLLTARHEGHTDTVAVEGKHGVTLGDEDGRAAAVGQERVLAVGLTDKDALLHLAFLVETVLVVGHLRQVVVPRHLLHDVDGQHLGRMGVQTQGLENLTEREGLVGVTHEQPLQGFGHLLLGKSLSSFFLSHKYIGFS